jgi:hypothetical protein
MFKVLVARDDDGDYRNQVALWQVSIRREWPGFNPNQHFLQQVKNLDNIDQVLYQVWRFGCVSLLSGVCQNFAGREIGEHILSCLPIGSVSYALSTTGGVVAVDSGIPRD